MTDYTKKQRRSSEKARERSKEDARRMREMKEEAEEKARIQKEKQEAAAKRRKMQLLVRMILLFVVVVAAIVGIVQFSAFLEKKKLEPDNGAGTNILQAAENSDADQGQNAQEPVLGSQGDGTTDGTLDATSNAGLSGPPGNSNQLTICMMGNAITDQRLLEASATDTGYNFDNLFANISNTIHQYDIRILSHESIIGGAILGASGSPVYNSPFEEADAIAKAGFNVVLQATDHALDKGQAGIRNCLSYWNNVYPKIAVLGIHDPSEESEDIYVYEKNGIRVAILNYTFGTNLEADESAEVVSSSVNLLDQEIIKKDVQSAREMADYVILCPHWGEESKPGISEEQEEWTALFLSLGVDLVLGTHPHQAQSVDVYRRKDGHQMLVYNSLGNFYSNQNEKEENVGGMAQIVLEKNGQGQVETYAYGIRPVVCHESRDGEAFTMYFLDEYAENLAENNDVKATDPEFSYSFCQEWATQVFGDVKPLEW